MNRKSDNHPANLFAWLQLCALTARRILPLALLALAFLVSAFLFRGAFAAADEGGSNLLRPGIDLARLATSAMSETARDEGALRYFFAAHGVWVLAATLLAPFLVWRAAVQSGGAARRTDRLWLDVKPVRSFFVSTAQLLGGVLAAGGCIALLSAVVIAARPDSLRTVDAAAGFASGPSERLLIENLEWAAPELQPSGESLRARISLRLVSGGTDPVLNAVFAARRTGAAEWSTSLVRIGDGAALEVELPAGPKGAEFKLSRVEGGARALVRSEEVALYRSLQSLWAVLRVGLRIALALTAAIALALGFGHFVSAPSAASAAILPWVLSFLAPHLPWVDYLPAGDLAFALEEWAEGRAVAALGREAWIGATILVAVGLTLSTIGRKRGEA